MARCPFQPDEKPSGIVSRINSQGLEKLLENTNPIANSECCGTETGIGSVESYIQAETVPGLVPSRLDELTAAEIVDKVASDTVARMPAGYRPGFSTPAHSIGGIL